MNGWTKFTGELDRWGDEGRVAAFWWRDDDATTMTPELGRLLSIGAKFGVSVAVAVIPARADETLVRIFDVNGDICVLQHGYAHSNHAASPEKKSELGADRPCDDVAAELLRGHEMLAGLFDDGFLPVIVPPWNRIAEGIVSLLPKLGYIGLSTFAPRHSRRKDRFVTVNTHVDIIDWHDTRAFGGERKALDAAVDHLAAKRAGTADEEEPTGLLTHHLVHDAQCWGFVDRFLAETTAHPAARWVSARHAFGAGA